MGTNPVLLKSRSHRRALTWLLALGVGCDSQDASDTLPREIASADSPAVQASDPILEAARRHFNEVPDSVRLRAGACPFECCVYGEWRSDSAIPLLAEPLNDAPAVDTLRPTERFRARTGYVEVLGPSIVVVTDTVPNDSGRGFAFVPGDTVVVLDYVGESFWNVWHDGSVHEVSAFWGAEVGSPKGIYYGDYRREWWVNAESPRGRSGWFRADLDVQLSGVDACGTPI
jgi:hypothetical protein